MSACTTSISKIYTHVHLDRTESVLGHRDDLTEASMPEQKMEYQIPMLLAVGKLHNGIRDSAEFRTCVLARCALRLMAGTSLITNVGPLVKRGEGITVVVALLNCPRLRAS